jgi:hypothetical protein
LGEAGITNMEQVAAGMRIARQQAKPFLPSPGQFIAWCRAEESAAIGLPDAAELVDMVYQYSRTRGQYPDAESYPWPNHATYWMVTTLYQVMRSAGLSDAELRRRALMNWRRWSSVFAMVSKSRPLWRVCPCWVPNP